MTAHPPQMMTGNPPWDHMSNKIAVLFHIASAKEPPKVKRSGKRAFEAVKGALPWCRRCSA